MSRRTELSSANVSGGGHGAKNGVEGLARSDRFTPVGCAGQQLQVVGEDETISGKTEVLVS